MVDLSYHLPLMSSKQQHSTLQERNHSSRNPFSEKFCGKISTFYLAKKKKTEPPPKKSPIFERIVGITVDQKLKKDVWIFRWNQTYEVIFISQEFLQSVIFNQRRLERRQRKWARTSKQNVNSWAVKGLLAKVMVG